LFLIKSNGKKILKKCRINSKQILMILNIKVILILAIKI
jgi:hypothetical protein